MAGKTIVDVGNVLAEVFRVREHPAFGGVSGGHSPTGYHPKGQAIDVTDWRPDVAPAYPGGEPKHWKVRTGELKWRANQLKKLGLFDEVLGPGDPGHDTHVHLALAGNKPITPQQIQWLTTGRTLTETGELTDVMPGAQPQAQPSTPTKEQEITSATALSLFGGLLNALKPKEKTLQQQLTEGLFSQVLTRKQPSMLMQYMQSGPLDEIIYSSESL